MLRLSKRSEYALMALTSLGKLSKGEKISAPNLARSEDLPRDLLAKVMQDLKHAGLVSSTQGANGGYRLTRPLRQIALLDAIRPFEEGIGLVDCVVPGGAGCDRCDDCTLRDPMSNLNAWLLTQLATVSVAHLGENSGLRSLATGDLREQHSEAAQRAL